MRLLAVLIPMLFLLTFSCLENSIPNPPVEVHFHLLNRNGEIADIFEQGEEIYFELRIKNNSADNIGLFRFEPTNEQLFMVYQDGQRQEVGSPIKAIGQQIDILGYPIEKSSSILFKIPWTGQDSGTVLLEGWGAVLTTNEPLGPGTYLTAFSMNFVFAKFSIEKEFKIDFTIK